MLAHATSIPRARAAVACSWTKSIPETRAAPMRFATRSANSP
jgi:hypothetical protein